MILLERPYTSKQICLFARKNGSYNRPIISYFTDLRIEDYINDKLLRNKRFIVAKLPDIAEANQIDKFIISDENSILGVDYTIVNVHSITNGDYFMLPFENDPWWEFAMCLDESGNYIKAPKIYRKSEPSPDDIDEKLDDYHINRGNINVVSPITLSKIQNEDYIKRIKLI